MPDQDGYPTEGDLARISAWPVSSYADAKALLDFVRSIWWHADWGFTEPTVETGYGRVDKLAHVYHVSTAGWSGNESIIGAMSDNFMFWSLTWYSHRRGGHYEFVLEDL